jgi:hypothetical protein
MAHERPANILLITVGQYTTLYTKAGQLQPAGGPHNSLRTRLRATVYTQLEKGRYLQTISYAESTVE